MSCIRGCHVGGVMSCIRGRHVEGIISWGCHDRKSDKPQLRQDLQ